ncbi:MAG: putative F0F1-ATPase subunit Ca2+/Mg2+ transporter [Bacteroidota bacterium]|jgi:F0F1-type ATP synthase assembly protein I
MPAPKSPQEKQSTIKSAGKYSGMVVQLLGSCLAGVFIGKWLDAKMQLDRPLWAVFLTIFFMVAALYSLYKQLLKDG